MVGIDGMERTGRAFGMCAEAGVVRALFAGAWFCNLDNHAHSALAAEESGLQVMAVLDGLFTVDLAFQDSLYFLEGFLINERFVISWVLCTFVTDDAEAVRVCEELVYLACLDGLCRNLDGFGHHESALDQFVGG